MATTTTRTRNLRLFLSSGLTAEARANLEILDRLGDTTYLDATETITFRAKTDIVLQPGDENVNGTKNNGKVYVGTANNKAHTMEFWPVSEAVFKAPVVVNDKLKITTTNAERKTLTVNTGSADRSLSLQGNLSTSGNITLISPDSSILNIPTGTQTLVNTSSVQTVSNKTIDLSNTVVLTGKITNADIQASANIAYNKLNLTNSVKATDFTTSAGKLLYNQVNLEGSLKNSDWSSQSADKLAGTKVNTDFDTQELVTSSFVSLRNTTIPASTAKAKIKAPDDLTKDYELILPNTPGLTGQALAMLVPTEDNQIPLGWVSTGTTILQTGEIYVGLNNNPVNVNPGQIAASEIAASTSNGLTLKPTTVVPDSYGSETEVATLTVDSKGRLTAAATVAIAIPSTQITDFSEAVQDVVGENLVGNSDDIEATYDDANDGLTLALVPTAITTKTEKAAPASTDLVLISDSEDSDNLKKVSLNSIVNLSGASHAETWTSGTTIEITHNLDSRDVIVQLFDVDTFEDILVDSIKRTTLNTLDLTASVAPTGSGWRVLVKRI